MGRMGVFFYFLGDLTETQGQRVDVHTADIKQIKDADRQAGEWLTETVSCAGKERLTAELLASGWTLPRAQTGKSHTPYGTLAQ